MIQYYGRHGEPISLETYLTRSGFTFYTTIRQEYAPNGVWVSTVWLGFDHNPGNSKPMIFETMDYDPNTDTYSNCQRYSTEQEALDGHIKRVQEHNAARNNSAVPCSNMPLASPKPSLN